MHKFYYSSSSVGSGKTYKAALWMKMHPKENVLYITPTTKLSGEVKRRIDTTAGRTSSRIVNTTTDNSGYSPKRKALNMIHRTMNHDGKTIILTTTNFMRILPLIENPENWTLIMDEAFQPVNYEVYNSSNNPHIIEQYFDIDSYKRATAKIDKKERMTAIYESMDFGDADELSARGIVDFVEAAMNPSVNLQLTKQAMDDYDKWHGLWYVTPEYFGGYKQAIFLSALFEESLLFRIWENLYNFIDWVEHPDWFDESRNTHVIHGSNIRIGYLLDDNDNASKTTFNTIVDGKKVIEHMVGAVDSFFESEYILSLNNRMMRNVPDRAVSIPPMSYGIDSYKHMDNVASLTASNPRPEQLLLIMPLVDEEEFTPNDIRNAFRRSSIYQNIGRCSLRDTSVTTTRTILVASKADADYFHSLFEGSTYLGKRGDIPGVSYESKFPDGMGPSDQRAWNRAGKPDDIDTWYSTRVKTRKKSSHLIKP